jgi:hypothetical protein
MNLALSLCVLCLMMYIKIHVSEHHVYRLLGWKILAYDIFISAFGVKTCAEALAEYAKMCLKCAMFMLLGNTFRCILNHRRTTYLCN